MAEMRMVTYKLDDLQFFNKLEKPGQIELQANGTFNVKYTKDNTRCIAKLYQCVKNKSDGPDHQLMVSVELTGMFEIKGEVTDQDKKEFHVRCYEQLMACAETLARQVCIAGGMAQIQFPRQFMSAENVVIKAVQK